MFYYTVAVSGINLDLLTYQSEAELSPLTQVIVPFRKKAKEGYIIEAVEKPEFQCETVTETTGYYLPESYLKTARFIAGYYFCQLAESLALFTPFSKDAANPKQAITTAITLSPKQDEALTFCMGHPVSLLFGDTGSGKTEIYMKCFENLINEGKTAIFLMPEISLTPQIEKRLKEHFGDLVAIWHSKITKPAKKKILDGIEKGEIKIVAGARSCLFLPLPELGAIIVDEEHDDSYKSSQRPRYHARDLAIVIGKEKKIPVILGSATPSVTSYEKFPRFRLKGQYFEAQKRFTLIRSPEETPTDMSLHALRENFRNNKQAIIFSPTRANFKYLVCKSCGKTVECPYCSVGMSLHLDKNLIKCHYCTYAEPIPKQCPSCKENTLTTQRTGTEEIVRWLNEMLPDARVEKFDRDSVGSNKRLKEMLNAFNKKEIDVLVGTQMLSKGHNYHEVNLALILGIDYILHTADFKAPERTISLIFQIAGRAGRKEDANVLIQSINSEYIEQYLSDYELFIKDELQNRRDLYPPYTKLARVLFSHGNDQRTQDAMHEMKQKLERFKDVEVVGAGRCAVEKIANKYRYQILLRSTSSKALLTALQKSRNAMAEIDIDPVQFS